MMLDHSGGLRETARAIELHFVTLTVRKCKCMDCKAFRLGNRETGSGVKSAAQENDSFFFVHFSSPFSGDVKMVRASSSPIISRAFSRRVL